MTRLLLQLQRLPARSLAGAAAAAAPVMQALRSARSLTTAASVMPSQQHQPALRSLTTATAPSVMPSWQHQPALRSLTTTTVSALSALPSQQHQLALRLLTTASVSGARVLPPWRTVGGLPSVELPLEAAAAAVATTTAAAEPLWRAFTPLRDDVRAPAGYTTAAQAWAGRLGVTFREPRLLTQAMLHPSYAEDAAAPANNRLEFLGDVVLALGVTTYLFQRFPTLTEGELTRLRNLFCANGVLAEAATALALDTVLLVGPTWKRRIGWGIDADVQGEVEEEEAEGKAEEEDAVWAADDGGDDDDDDVVRGRTDDGGDDDDDDDDDDVVRGRTGDDEMGAADGGGTDGEDRTSGAAFAADGDVRADAGAGGVGGRATPLPCARTKHGRAARSAMADALEALLGGVFLDQGFDAAMHLLYVHVIPELERATRDERLEPATTYLQNAVLALFGVFPVFDVLNIEGRGARRWGRRGIVRASQRVRVRVGRTVVASGTGHSVQAARTQAAEHAIAALGLERLSALSGTEAFAAIPGTVEELLARQRTAPRRRPARAGGKKSAAETAATRRTGKAAAAGKATAAENAAAAGRATKAAAATGKAAAKSAAATGKATSLQRPSGSDTGKATSLQRSSSAATVAAAARAGSAALTAPRSSAATAVGKAASAASRRLSRRPSPAQPGRRKAGAKRRALQQPA